MTDYHKPVLVREVLEGLHVRPGSWYVDGTLGGAGHTTEILKLGGSVLGIDADSDALSYARKRIGEELPDKKEGEDWVLAKGNFRDMASIAREHGCSEVAGVLMDLGVSSFQLDTESKGFSYRFDQAALDMRFDQSAGVTACEYINSASREELYEAFTKFGEEERAGTIVNALVRARSVRDIKTVGDVVASVKKAVGDNRETASVLSRVFQALRIVVNDEMGALSEGLAGAHELLVSGGRLVVITFHSLEDRFVKQYMLRDQFRVVSKKPIIASYEEQGTNRRSRSAKLRIAEKI